MLDKDSLIAHIRSLLLKGNVSRTIHFYERIAERNLSEEDVFHCILQGEIIENYHSDNSMSSCLVFGYCLKGEIIHTVVAYNSDEIKLITAYKPSLEKFHEDFKTRRK